MVKLSKAEIDLYKQKGFVVPKFRVSEEIIQRLREALEDTLRDNPHVRPEQLASIHTPKTSVEDTIGHKTFLDVALDNELVDPVSSILGDHIIMWGVNYSVSLVRMVWKYPCIRMVNIGLYDLLQRVVFGWHLMTRIGVMVV